MRFQIVVIYFGSVPFSELED